MDRIGRYEVVRELGHGGMGSVYLGRDPELRRSVALKLLHHANSAYQLKQEARALAALNHPGIVTIFEIGDHDERQFIAMEYLAGVSLRSLLATNRPSRAEILAICAKVALAVDAAHHAGILHRDIKPENVVVGENGVVKVVDFGIARRLDGDRSIGGTMTALEPSSTESIVEGLARTLKLHVPDDTIVSVATQTVFGTPAYMAPEVLVGEPSKEPSDVYSLGVMLYECLASRRPRDSSNLVVMMAQVIDGEPIQRLDDPLADFVERMLANDPAQRPTLSEVANTLRDAAPVRVPVAGSPAKSRRRIAGAAIGLVLVGASIATWRLTRSPAQSASTSQVVLAVEPLEVSTMTYGAGLPSAHAVGDVLAMLLSNRINLRTISPQQLEKVGADRSRLRITHSVRGSFVEKDHRIYGTLAIVGTDDKVVARVTGDASANELEKLVFVLGEEIWKKLFPGVPFDDRPDPGRAVDYVDTGTRHLMDRAWFVARPYLEAAVLVDPSRFDAWSAVASIRGWTMAPQGMIDAAVARAVATAPDGPRKRIWEGAAFYYSLEFPKALAVLAPLEGTDLSKQDSLDLHYYLGEALWHDGQFTAGVAHFEHVLKTDAKFKPAAIHAGQFALGKRNHERAMQLIALQQYPHGSVLFSAGRYEELASGELTPDNLHAEYVLDRKPIHLDQLKQDIPRAQYGFAMALRAGDLATARKHFADLMATVDARTVTDGSIFALENVVEAALSAELVDETKKLIDILAKQPSKRAQHAHDHFAPLAAPFLKTKPPLVREGMTSRDRKRAQAIEAELAGDRATAAKLLAELVAEPSFAWDYPERAALIRNLRALGRTEEVRAVCADTMRPAVFRLAFLPLQRTCKL